MGSFFYFLLYYSICLFNRIQVNAFCTVYKYRTLKISIGCYCYFNQTKIDKWNSWYRSVILTMRSVGDFCVFLLWVILVILLFQKKLFSHQNLWVDGLFLEEGSCGYPPAFSVSSGHWAPVSGILEKDPAREIFHATTENLYFRKKFN